MRSLFILILVAFCSLGLAAQSPVRPIRGELLQPKGIYRFDAFNEGTVVFRNGIISAAKMNYNISSDEMHFISNNNDTLAVADPLTINFISLNGSRFYYDHGYLQTIDTFADVLLAFKQVLTAQQQRKGGYNITTPHESVRTYGYFTGNGQKYILGTDEQVLVSAKETYYFGDAFGHFSKAGKEFLYAHFPARQQQINDFIRTRHIRFNSAEDLVELLHYCTAGQ